MGEDVQYLTCSSLTHPYELQLSGNQQKSK